MSIIHIDTVICPVCGRETIIREYGASLQVRTVTKVYDQYEVDSYLEDDYDYELERYVCGECDATIATTDQELIEFLIANGHLPPIDTVNKIEEIE